MNFTGMSKSTQSAITTSVQNASILPDPALHLQAVLPTFVVLYKQADIHILCCIDGVRNGYSDRLVIARLLWNFLQRDHLQSGGHQRRTKGGAPHGSSAAGDDDSCSVGVLARMHACYDRVMHILGRLHS